MTGQWWVASALVTGCAITPAEVHALTEMRPSPVGLHAEVREGGVLLTAAVPASSARAARGRMRTAVHVLLDGFGASVVDVTVTPDSGAVTSGIGTTPWRRVRDFCLRRAGRGY